MTSKLDDIFTAYEKRKEAEERAAAEKAAKLARDRDVAEAFFRERIVPPLRNLVQQIREKGHDANLIENLEADAPTVTLEFTPKRRASATAAPAPSRLTFTAKGDWIETLQEVAHGLSRGIGERWALREVTSEFSGKQGLVLVEAALKHH